MRIYSNKIFTVYEGNANFPGGRANKVYSVGYSGAAVVLPLERGIIVMEYHYRPVIRKWLYELPAGRIERGETPEQCARRELAEETGMKAGKLLPLFRSYATPGYSNEIDYFFEASQLGKAESKRDAGEVLRLKRVSIGKALQMVKNGSIIDGKAIQALLYCKEFRCRAEK
ncbi:MAG: NUDIX hydrolase [Candidatus Micrarchaeia archaeon]